MTRVLVTGGTGSLGRATVTALQALGATVRIASRTAGGERRDVEWAVVNPTTGEGLRDALQGVQVVVHAAHDGARPMRGDQDGLRRLLDAIDATGGPHLVYVSIVGAHAVPGQAYYAAKTRAEALVRQSGHDRSIFRATQFHEFIDGLLAPLDRWPVVMLPRGLKFQPVSVTEAGEALARHALAPTPTAEIVGPRIHDLDHLVRTRDAIRGVRRPIWTFPTPLPITRAIAAGALTSSTAPRAHQTWEAWLTQRAQLGDGTSNAARRAHHTPPTSPERGPEAH